MLKLASFTLQQLLENDTTIIQVLISCNIVKDLLYLSVFEKGIKQVIDDISREYFDTKTIGHFLSISLHSNIKC